MSPNQGGFYMPQFGSGANNPFSLFPTSQNKQERSEPPRPEPKPEAPSVQFEEGGTARELAPISAEEPAPSRERMHLIDLIIEEERKMRADRLHVFEQGVEQQIEDLQIEPYLNRLNDFLAHADDLLENQEMDPNIQKSFDASVQKLSSRFKKEFQTVYSAWVEAQIGDPNSWLANERASYVLKLQMANTALEVQAQLKKLKVLEGMQNAHLMNSVMNRVKVIEQTIQKMVETPPFPTEEIFREFLLETAWDRWQENEERKPTLLERITGKKQTAPNEEFDALLGQLTQAYGGATDEFGLSKRDRIKGTVSEKDLRPTAKGSRPKKKVESNIDVVVDRYDEQLITIQEILDGEEEHYEDSQEKINAVGLESYIQELGLPEEFTQAVEALRPILGRKHFIKEVEFVLGVSAINPNYAGVFSEKKQKIELYKFRALPADYVKTICHECGHAMRLDQTLSLRNAVQFNIEMNQAIIQAGFTSQYSAIAKQMYYQQMIRSIGTAFTSDHRLVEQVQDSQLDEEWAEMLGYSMVSTLYSHIAPEKEVIVRKYLSKFGIDFDELRKVMSSQAAGYDNPTLERSRQLMTVLMQRDRSPEEVREELAKLNLE